MPAQIVVVYPDEIELPVGPPFLYSEGTVLDAVVVATRGNVMVREALSDGAGYEIDIAYDAALRRFVAEMVKVDRAGPGAEITSRLIRELTIQEIIAGVSLSEMTTLRYSDEDGRTGELSGSEALAQIPPAAERDTDEVLRDAVLIDCLAKLGNWPPLVTIAERLQVSHSTAKRLVARAKERNFLVFSDGDGTQAVNVDE